MKHCVCCVCVNAVSTACFISFSLVVFVFGSAEYLSPWPESSFPIFMTALNNSWAWLLAITFSSEYWHILVGIKWLWFCFLEIMVRIKQWKVNLDSICILLWYTATILLSLNPLLWWTDDANTWLFSPLYYIHLSVWVGWTKPCIHRGHFLANSWQENKLMGCITANLQYVHSPLVAVIFFVIIFICRL